VREFENKKNAAVTRVSDVEAWKKDAEKNYDEKKYFTETLQDKIMIDVHTLFNETLNGTPAMPGKTAIAGWIDKLREAEKKYNTSHQNLSKAEKALAQN
jgi:hypothetical protein